MEEAWIILDCLICSFKLQEEQMLVQVNRQFIPRFEQKSECNGRVWGED